MKKRTINPGTDCEAYEFGESCVTATATAMSRIDYPSGKEKWEVNWSCIGPVSIERAKEFHDILGAAIACAEKKSKEVSP